MKKALLAITIIIILASVALVVFAHPGNTDGAGGHYNRSTGEYHYHHGYSAHSHYDMDGDGDIDCPYDFDNKSSVNNSNNSKQKSPAAANKNTTYKSKKSSPSIAIKIILILSILFLISWTVAMPIYCLITFILSRFTKDIPEKVSNVIMWTVYALTSIFLIYTVVIW